MEISSKQILKVLYILSWIIFIGICIEAGGFLFNAIFAITYNPFGAHNFWEGMDLSGLYEFDKGYFMVVTSMMVIVTVMKALMFYFIVKLLHDKKLNMVSPFNEDVRNFIFRLSYLALGIGMFSHWGSDYSKWLIKKGIIMPDAEGLQLGGADVWLFMAVILFVVAQIFKRGIELQEENELTV